MHSASESTAATGDWTRGDPDGTDDATTGIWVREDPNGVDDAGGTPVQPEDDTTAAGTLAWVTGNPRTNGNFDPGGDGFGARILRHP